MNFLYDLIIIAIIKLKVNPSKVLLWSQNCNTILLCRLILSYQKESEIYRSWTEINKEIEFRVESLKRRKQKTRCIAATGFSN